MLIFFAIQAVNCITWQKERERKRLFCCPGNHVILAIDKLRTVVSQFLLFCFLKKKITI